VISGNNGCINDWEMTERKVDFLKILSPQLVYVFAWRTYVIARSTKCNCPTRSGNPVIMPL
jgi:hypothetical protein